MRKLRKQEETRELISQNELNQFVERLRRLRDELERILQLFTDVPSEISSRRNELVERVEKLSQQIQQTDPEKVDEQFLSQIQEEINQIEEGLNNLREELVPLVEEGQVVVQGYSPSASTVDQILRPAFDELHQTERQVVQLMEMARRGRKVSTPTFTTVTPPGGFVFPFPLSETIMPTREEEEVALQYWVIVIEGKDQGTAEYEESMQNWRSKLETERADASNKLNAMWTKFYNDLVVVIRHNVPYMSNMANEVTSGGIELDPSLTMAVDRGWNLHVGLEFFLTHIARDEVEKLTRLKVEYKKFIDEAIARREENPSVSSKELRNLSQTFRDNPYPIVFWQEVGKIAERIMSVESKDWLEGKLERKAVSAFNLAAVISMHEFLHLLFGHTRSKFEEFMDVIKSDPEYMQIIREAYERNRKRLMAEFVELWSSYIIKHKDVQEWFREKIKEEKGIEVPKGDVIRLIEEAKEIVVPPFEKLPEEVMTAFLNGLSNIFFDLMINAIWKRWEQSDRKRLPNFDEFEQFYVEARQVVKEILREHLFFGKIMERLARGQLPVMKMMREVLLKEGEGGEETRKHVFYDAEDYGLSHEDVENIWKVIQDREFRDISRKIVEDAAKEFFDNIHIPPPTGGGRPGKPIFKLPPLWGDDPNRPKGEEKDPRIQRRAREKTISDIREGSRGAGKEAGSYRTMIDNIYTIETAPEFKIEEIVSDLAVKTQKYLPEHGAVMAPSALQTRLYEEPIKAMGGETTIMFEDMEDEAPSGGMVIPFIFIVDTSGSVSADEFAASLHGISNIIRRVNQTLEQKKILYHVYVVPADVQIDEIIDLGTFGDDVSEINRAVSDFIRERKRVAGGGGTDMLNALQEVVGLLKRVIQLNKENPLSGKIEFKEGERSPDKVTYVTLERSQARKVEVKEEEVEVVRKVGNKEELAKNPLTDTWKNYVGAVVVIITDGGYVRDIPVNYLQSLEQGDFKVIVRVISYGYLDPELVRSGYAVKGEKVRRPTEQRRAYHLRKQIDPELLKIAVWSRILRKLREDYLRR